MIIKAEHRVVITGAGGGLGTALAQQLAARGCRLVLADVSDAALNTTANSLSASASEISQHRVDVSDANAMQAFAEDIRNRHGSINLLINNAGITLQKNFSTHCLEQWQRVMGINFWGAVYGCHFFDELLAQTDEAHVVNLASMSSFVGLPAQSSYCASKSAVEGLSDSLWAEWSQRGIGVTSVHPGAIRTKMINATLEESDDVEAAKANYDMAQKMGVSAEFAASRIIKAVEKNKKRIRIGRDAYLIDYLSRFAPWLVDLGMKKIAARQAS